MAVSISPGQLQERNVRFMLDLAVERGQLDVIKRMAGKGLFDKCLLDTGIVIASLFGKLDILLYFEEIGGDPKAYGSLPLHVARKYRHKEVTEYLIERYELAQVIVKI